MNAFGPGTDGMDGKYKEMLLDFRKQMEGMQAQADAAMESQQKGFESTFLDLSKQYGKGFEDVKAQLIKANMDLVSSFAKNFEALKANMKENHEGLRDQAKSNFDNNLKKFKDNCDEMIKKIPILSPKLYKDLVQALEDHQHKSVPEWEKSYKDALQKLEADFQQAVKGFTLPIAANHISAVVNKQGAAATVKPSVGQPMKASPGHPALVPTAAPTAPSPAKTTAVPAAPTLAKTTAIPTAPTPAKTTAKPTK